ncbi:U2 small nuclear ribonucleoprotein auxiliary factor 35 kDa subunit-related protein 1 [Hylaeus volcanicus]|uniref:U2 small nuclear ribonucleoprotein auxiliary factor 35 kDa subunit-related protein 1 n=1 Tax=Hylaeus volcanicus TaxID=313075 RepID=UPI0023B87701|nr:U2 small nuclear ribonucleoprotein auxiliary factor 35 kDa subunit-related protein 1 [Hylaeus volcanicus]
MEGCCSTKKSHKEWRRTAKKERRRRLRRKAAAEREADAERLRAALEKSANYLKWIEDREIAEKEKEKKEEEERDEREKLWLEEEVKAQKEWQVLQERKQKARQQQLEQEMKIREEFETKQEAIRKKQEEEKRKREEEIRKREELLKEIDDYIDNGIKTPEALREVINSQPGKELCPFFTKTGACRYGDTCSRNHRRVCLSKVILVPGFYTHFSLEKNSAEYDTDVALEFESSETRQHFREFYNDVVPELESFGRIKTLKYCCNTEVHLRGNLYVEYYTEREAARAMRKLKGRWYAGRQLNCEFANLKSWRSAVCGMAKCPKGRACNFLHTFKNPHDEYDIKSPPRWAKQLASSSQEATTARRSDHRNKSKWEDGSDAEDGKDWRWSESPEPEPHSRTRNSEKRHRRSDETESRQRSARDKRYDQSTKDTLSDNAETPVKRRRSSSRKHFEDENDDEISNGRESSRRHYKKYQRRREEEDNYDESKSSRHSRRRYSKSGDKAHRSKARRYPSRYSKREKEDREKVRHKSKNQREFSDDSSRRKSKKSSEVSNIEESDYLKNVRDVKSKWDKENSDEISVNSTDSSDTDNSSTEEKKGSLRLSKKTSTEYSDDEWATTDSESDEKVKEK